MTLTHAGGAEYKILFAPLPQFHYTPLKLSSYLR